MKKITPIFVVEAIEPCVPFWKDRLGFVMLAKDGVEVMYQTTSGIAADVPAVAASGAGTRSLVFIEVADVADVARRLEGIEVVVPMRKTFYGSEEFWVRAPCGTLVGFAQMGAS